MDKLQRNKETDFQIIEKASEILQDKLRLDEMLSSDLHDQFLVRGENVAKSHKYFIEPYKSTWGSMVNYSDFIPLPQKLIEKCNSIECASFMGLIPEINRAWITIDNKLYLWNYCKNDDSSIEMYDGMSEVIVSVSISAPKEGIFLDNVKYLLVVSSPVEVVLLAISLPNLQNDIHEGICSQIKIIPTAFTLPSDNITMFKVIGSQFGRIFMAGNDGNLYELEYDYKESGWSALLGLDGNNNNNETNRVKCQKVNHFAWNWKFVHLIPPFLKNLTGSVDEGSLTDLVMDDTRNVLYALSSTAILSAFYLGADGKEMHYFVRNFNILEETKNFLSSHRHNLPESSPKADAFSSTSSSPGFNIVGMFVIPLIESKKSHLVVILGNGIRIYLFMYIQSSNPNSIAISYVRSPPSANAIKYSYPKVTADDIDLDSGFTPTFIPAQSMKLSSSFYSHGCLLMTLDKGKQPDELLAVFEDSICRSTLLQSELQSYSLNLREGLSVVLDSTKHGGKIYDIKESCSQILIPEVSKLVSLFAQSGTPASNPMVRETTHHRSQLKAGARMVPVTNSNAIGVSDSKLGLGIGYDKTNVDQTLTLNELCTQHIPVGDFSLQRKFMVLTNQGIHILRKVRPCDLLHRFITQLNDQNEYFSTYFSNCFGTLQFSAMCIALACGLPCDAGGTTTINPANSLSSSPLESVQKRAMNMVFEISEGPTFKTIGGPALMNNNSSSNGINFTDSRLVMNGTSHDFIKSVAHDALFLVASRILRPIWLRPLVVGSNKSASLSSIWNSELICQIRKPIVEFIKLLKGYFPLAVFNDPNKDFSATLSKPSAQLLVTKQMHEQAQLNVNPQKHLQQKAKNLEEASLNSLYRLVSRSLHALQFVDILLSLKKDWNIAIDWSKLVDVSFRSIVVSSRVHEKIKKMINELINSICTSDKPQIANRTLTLLSQQCFHYFSAGDRYTFEASNIFDKIKKMTTQIQVDSEKEIDHLSAQAVQLLLKSSKYWTSLEYVSGQQSELVTRCGQLRGLGKIGRDGLVDLCIEVARNFNQIDVSSRSLVVVVSSPLSKSSAPSDSWDISLYHGGSVMNENESVKATTSCYDCLIKNIISINTNSYQVGDGPINRMNIEPESSLANAMSDMINRAVTISSDREFHDLLYDKLYDNYKDYLLSIRNKYLEDYLRGKDCCLLYSYYEMHSEHTKAALLMSTMAKTEDNLDINIRIKYFEKAIFSAEKASSIKDSGEREFSIIGSPTFMNPTNNLNILELKDFLEVAGFQSLAEVHLFNDFNFSRSAKSNYNENQLRKLERMEHSVSRLKYKLLTITELYNDICEPYRFWDISLLLINASKLDNPELIAKLWRSLIYRIVPDSGVTEESCVFLELKRDPSRVFIYERYQTHSDNGATFENAQVWLPVLQEKIVYLGKLLSGSLSTSLAFPLTLILEELEEIISTLSISKVITDRGLVAQIFYEIGVSHGSLIEAYMELFDKWTSKGPEKLLQILSSSSFIFLNWTRYARDYYNKKNLSHSSVNVLESRQLIQAIRSGRIRTWIEKLRRHISILISRASNASNRDLLENTSAEFNEVNRRVTEISLL